MSSPSNFIARALVALAALACLAVPGRAADAPAARKPSATAAMSGEAPAAMKDALDAAGLPHYVAPEAYSVDLVMNGDGKTFTMKRFIDNAKVRTEISAEGQNLVMIEAGDEKGTTYNVMPDQKMAIKQTAGTMASAMKAAHQELPKPKAAAVSAPEGYKVEDLGDEAVDGKTLKKLRFTGGEGSALGWFDKATGAPARMETDANGKKSSIEWKNLKAGPQPAELFTVPKEYKVTDMDEMIAKMNSMQGASGMGSMVKGMGQGMVGGMGQNFGQSMGSSLGSKLGASFGGPLGAVAGQYIGGKIGGMIGKKVADTVTGAGSGRPSLAADVRLEAGAGAVNRREQRAVGQRAVADYDRPLLPQAHLGGRDARNAGQLLADPRRAARARHAAHVERHDPGIRPLRERRLGQRAHLTHQPRTGRGEEHDGEDERDGVEERGSHRRFEASPPGPRAPLPASRLNARRRRPGSPAPCA